MTTIKLHRAAHTATGLRHFGAELGATVIDIGADARRRNPWVAVRWPNGRVYSFRINSGWGESPVKSYQIAPDDLAGLQQLAQERGFRVSPVAAPPSVKRMGTRRPKELPVAQMTIFELPGVHA